MKRNILVFTGLGFLFLMIIAGLSPVAALSGMQDKLGVSFSDSNFAVTVDLNVDSGEFAPGALASNIQVLHDYVQGSGNGKLASSDSNPNFNQKFFLAYKNVSGIETAYLAMQSMAGQLVIKAPTQNYYFGHFNGTAPFQSILQHYTSGGKDVFVKNTFRGFVAYTSSDADPQIDTSDKSLIGYPIVEKNFIDHINNALTSHSPSLPPIPSYNAVPIYTSDSFGMQYSNMFVLFQNQSATSSLDIFSSTVRNYLRGLDFVNLGGNIVAGALFDYVNFTYKINTVVNNATMTVVNVQAEYDLGPVSLLITKDDSSVFNDLINNVNGINNSNSFQIASSSYGFTLQSTFGSATVLLPAVSVYTGVAARTRINSAALQNKAEGFGISVVTSTNFWEQGSDIPFSDSESKTTTDASGYNIDLGPFNTKFTGKSTYNLTDDNGATTTHDIIVSVFTPNKLSDLLNIASVFNGYFEAQSKMTKAFATVFAQEVYDPLIYDPSNIGLTSQNTAYSTFIQMPKWSGYEINQDPTYSAVSLVSPGQSSSQGSSNSSGINTSVSSTNPIPGFEMFILFAALLPLIIIRKRKQKL